MIDRVSDAVVTLALCGDVMLGRGIDHVLPHPVDPALHGSQVRSADAYVWLAEQANGRIPRPISFSYVWGDALPEMQRAHARIINLETSVTTSSDYELKGINYRMHPRNVDALRAAHIDCCVLANNHVHDWGDAGFLETLDTLQHAGIRTAGAGRDLREAQRPAILPFGSNTRVLVFGIGCADSGIPQTWAAGINSPGVYRIGALSSQATAEIATLVRAARQPTDIVVASIHWGPNWGYEIPGKLRDFARALIDTAGVDLVHEHSSHHPKAIEVHRNRLILYGAGDLLNDYEGIGGYESFRPDLAVLYLADISPATQEIVRLHLFPFQIRRFRLTRPDGDAVRWLCERLDAESRRFGTRVQQGAHGKLDVTWLREPS